MHADSGIFLNHQLLWQNLCNVLKCLLSPPHSFPQLESYLGLARLGPALRGLQVGSTWVADWFLQSADVEGL